jgi:hypothetical protein
MKGASSQSGIAGNKSHNLLAVVQLVRLPTVDPDGSRKPIRCLHRGRISSDRCRDVGDRDHGVLQTVTIEDFAAGTSHQGAWFLRWHLFAALPHCIFARGPIPLIVPFLKIRFRSL